MDIFKNRYIITQNEPTVTNPAMSTVNITNPAQLMIQIPPFMPSFFKGSRRPSSSTVATGSVLGTDYSQHECALARRELKELVQIVTHCDAERCRIL